MKITIGKQESNWRLDKLIAQKFPQLSRTFIKEQVKSGRILVNEKPVKPSYELRENDTVVFTLEFTVSQKERKILPNPEIKLNIIYEDQDVIVINKPAGLQVHPRQDKNGLPLISELDSTLASGLLAHYPNIADVGDSPALRPGIVHRLDKDTSGVMIIAKNQLAFDWLKKQFQERKVAKKYIALVAGKPKENEGEIKNLLARSSSDPTKQKALPWDVKVKDGSREAITEYQVIKDLGDFTLLEAHPKTGRLHQIRVQFAALGLPVAGDSKYGGKTRQKPQGLARQFLHAQKLKITLPAGENKAFFAPLAQDLRETLEGLEKNLD